MALLDQVREVVDAAGKAVPVRVLCGRMMVAVVVVEVMVVMVGAGRVKARARAGAGAGGKARQQADRLAWALARARAGVLTLSAVTCALEVERGVHNCGSRRAPDELRRREGVS